LETLPAIVLPPLPITTGEVAEQTGAREAAVASGEEKGTSLIFVSGISTNQ